MSLLSSRPANHLLKKATYAAVGLIALWGVILVLAQIKPFWMDEWRLLYSLKFKTTTELFGPLDFNQQFPRVYLVLLKLFTYPFDYSYFTLRFPAFAIGMSSIYLSWKMMNRIFPSENNIRYLFVLIIIASGTFLKYLIQIKQYEMDIFLSLVALWQLHFLMSSQPEKLRVNGKYLLLCGSFLIAPFFSYTYPIVVAPVVVLVGIKALQHLQRKGNINYLFRLLFPLLLLTLSTFVFYKIDVSQVMHDSGMNCYWQDYLFVSNTNSTNIFHNLRNIWGFFGASGSGLFFIQLFSLLGVTGFIAASIHVFRNLRSDDFYVAVLRYVVLTVIIIIALFFMGKLPLGVARLNAFTVPLIAILVVNLLQIMKGKYKSSITLILYLGMFGNIVSIVVSTFTEHSYARAVTTYSNTEDAIIYAQTHGIPMVISPEVAYPDNIVDEIPCLENIDAASVLKTFPAYKERYKIPVFILNNAMQQKLPKGIKEYIVGDGVNYKLVKE